MADRPRTPMSYIFLITVLYVLQGINLGIAGSLPLFLVAHGATWKDRGTFNFVYYPFSFKLLWAPLTDVLYSKRFGRRKSWLIPIQLAMAGILILLSFYVQSFITNVRVVQLSAFFITIVLLTATQDICVDGLSISLFTATNPQWTSTTQTVGQTFGRFLGSSFLMTFESANFTNRYIREPLSLSPKSSGLFSIEQFIRFQAVALLIVTTSIALFFPEKKKVRVTEDEEKDQLSLIETYFSIVKLFKKKCVQQITLISLLSPMGMVAVNYMTHWSLVSQGVPRENLALVSIPVTLVTIIAPIFIRNTKLPLTWFAGSYLLYVITGVPTALYTFFTPRLLSTNYYYPLLILILASNEFLNAFRFSGQLGFYGAISEPRIGGTYMTLLVTIHNLGFALHSSIALYAANFLPTKFAFMIMTGICTVIGIVWLVFSFRMIRRLEKLPTHKWYLMPETITDNDTKLNEQANNENQESLMKDEDSE